MSALSANRMRRLSPVQAFISALGAVVCFHLGYAFRWLAPLLFLHLYFLLRLSLLSVPRPAFYMGLAIGLAIHAPQLWFFWTIFGPSALALWLVLAFWLGAFLGLSQCARNLLPGWRGAVLIPFLWAGLEYFRCESYYLRFAWLTVGNAWVGSPLNGLGVYGIGFILAAMASFVSLFSARRAAIGLVLALFLLAMFSRLPIRSDAGKGQNLRLAGVQLEFAGEKEIELSLIDLVKKHPETDLIVLSEYTFDGPVPARIRNWCRKNRKHLIAGGKEAAPGGEFFNTAFVVDPEGEIVFTQAKSVPIQFFKDGLPAPRQRVWLSPWGKIGICICYDLSYRRVVDELVRQGAEMLIVPTMDVVDWGEHQHRLHARVGPMRAAEYGVPIFRVCSSGISQIVESSGTVAASAPFPGENAIIVGVCVLSGAGRMPFDHWWGPLSVWVTVAFILWLILKKTILCHLSP